MKVSLISPIFNESSNFEANLQNIRSFFARFPVEIELLLVIAKNDPSVYTAPSDDEPKFQLQIVKCPEKTRGDCVKTGLGLATGDICLIFSWDLAIPLAEFFNFIQELVQNSKAKVLIGNRFDPKKKNRISKSPWHRTLEKLISEKFRKSGWSVVDPLTPFVALRQFDKTLLKKLKLSGWYYTPALISWAETNHWPIEELSVVAKYDSSQKIKSKIPLYKEYLRHLF